MHGGNVFLTWVHGNERVKVELSRVEDQPLNAVHEHMLPSLHVWERDVNAHTTEKLFVASFFLFRLAHWLGLVRGHCRCVDASRKGRQLMARQKSVRGG